MLEKTFEDLLYNFIWNSYIEFVANHSDIKKIVCGFECYEILPEEAFKDLLHKCPQLEGIKLTDCNPSKEHIRQLTSIPDLNLDFCKFNYNIAKALVSSENSRNKIICLALHNCDVSIDAPFMKEIAKLANLEALDLSFNRFVDNDSISIIAKMKKLKKISVQGSKMLDGGLSMLVSNENLQQIILGGMESEIRLMQRLLQVELQSVVMTHRL
jgi:hypothetical protein